MEYLTLQDLPHRYFHHQHSRAMPSEGPHYQPGLDKTNDVSLPSIDPNHHLRNSPPLQPGEQRPGQNSLPSFSQLLQTVREPSPPHTPSRRTDSVDNSPVVAPPHFSDLVWSEQRRRQIDPSAAMHHRPSNASEFPVYDSRRTSVVDPSLSSAFNSPSGPHPVLLPQPPPNHQHHHRPSLPYPLQPSNPAVHARHQSSPGPPGPQSLARYPPQHAPQHQPQQPPPPPQHAPHMVQGPFAHAPSHHGVPYNPRPRYFHEQHPAGPVHPYGRGNHPDAYYTSATYPQAPHHPGYENGYHPQAPSYNYTFQSTMGVDSNTFNRKRRGNLPKEATGILKAWFNSHRESPYPTEDEKVILCNQTQLTINQVSNWFINARRRAPQKEQRENREGADDA